MKPEHWQCEVGDTLSGEFSNPSFWIVTFDPVTHNQRFFIRPFIGGGWIRLN